MTSSEAISKPTFHHFRNFISFSCSLVSWILLLLLVVIYTRLRVSTWMKIFLLLLIFRQFYLIPTGEYFLVVKPKPCHHHGFSDDPVCAEDSFPSGSSSADIRIEQPSIGEPINSCTCFICPEEVQPVCCCQMFTKIQQGCQGKSI